MSFTIVYKTWLQDIEWLRYSLLSVDKYVCNIEEIVIYYQDTCFDKLQSMLQTITIKYPIRLISVHYDIHGYLKQMVVKCMCFKDIHTKYIIILDSDIVFKMEFPPERMLNNEKKIKWYIQTKTASNQHGEQWNVWKQSVKRMTHHDMTIYYMNNGFPFVFTRDSLEAAYDYFLNLHKKDYNTFCKDYLQQLDITPSAPITGPNGKFPQLATIFEEFEYLGWYCHRYSDDYVFMEGSSDTSECKIQFWSHGGITASCIDTIQAILN